VDEQREEPKRRIGELEKRNWRLAVVRSAISRVPLASDAVERMCDPWSRGGL
jgi:hypothetical protein